MSRNMSGFRQLVSVALFALTSLSTRSMAAEFYYASTTATESYTTFVGPIPVGGLAFTLPAATKEFNAAVITLNMPNLYLSQPTATNVMGATLQIVAPFSSAGPVVAIGQIGCDDANVLVSGTKPFTMVAKIPLSNTPEPVEAEWFSNPTGAGTVTVTTQTFASLSALLVKE